MEPALHGDETAVEELSSRLLRISEAPSLGKASSTRTLPLSIGPRGPGVGFPPGPGPVPDPGCPFTRFDALAGIGLAVVKTTPQDPARRGRLLGALDELGLCLGAAEGLNRAAVLGDETRLARQFRGLEREFAFHLASHGGAGFGGEPFPGDGEPFPRGGEPLPGGDEPGRPGAITPPRDDAGGIPLPCPPPSPDSCELLRRHCLGQLRDFLRRPPAMPDGSHVHAEGITGVTSSACSGDVVEITGHGFGSEQPVDVEVVMRREVDGEELCEPVAVVEWSDTRIRVRTPTGAVTGCVGFLDRAKLEEQRDLAAGANTRLSDLGSVLTCLGKGGVPTQLPLPSESDCPPCTDVNRIAAGAPRIRSFRAEAESGGYVEDSGFDGVTAIDPGQRLGLVWWVENADTLTLERESSDGPGFGSSSSVTDPPGHSYDLGVASHAAPELWTYRMTATNGCGSVTERVRVVATKSPVLAYSGVEVTQGIQTPTGSLPLVAAKPTVVRVFLSQGLGTFDGGVLPGVTGELRVTRTDGTRLGVLQPINGSSPTSGVAGATIDLPNAPQRRNVDDTLNFLLPAGWCRDDLRLSVTARVDDYGAPPSLPGSGRSDVEAKFLGTYSFNVRFPLDIQFLRVRWRGSDNVLRTPTADACRATLRRAMQRIAAPMGTISEHPDSPLQPGGTHDDDRMEDLLDDWDLRHRCEIQAAILSLMGAPSPSFPFCFDFPAPGLLAAAGEAFWALMPGSFYRGRAADIPAATLATPARTATDTGWSGNGLDTKAAHELSHCLDQPHIERCNAGGGDDPGDWPNNGNYADVVFDIANNRTIDGGTDLMTYCTSRWSMPARWNAVYSYVGG